MKMPTYKLSSWKKGGKECKSSEEMAYLVDEITHNENGRQKRNRIPI